jgi:hypothetical protein
MKIIVAGDIHAMYGYLNVMIQQHQPDLVLQCGDFGYFPMIDQYKDRYLNINTTHTKILFCDGNHEDHWELRKLKNLAIAPNIFYQPRGSTYRLPDGRNILFMGGANSIDKQFRTVGVSWWPEEVISQSDFQNLPDEKIDILITHTCSNELYDDHIQNGLMQRGSPRKDTDPSYAALSSLWEIYQPSQWFFGHFHLNMSGTLGPTRWHCLSAPEVGSGMWFMDLPD